MCIAALASEWMLFPIAVNEMPMQFHTTSRQQSVCHSAKVVENCELRVRCYAVIIEYLGWTHLQLCEWVGHNNIIRTDVNGNELSWNLYDAIFGLMAHCNKGGNRVAHISRWIAFILNDSIVHMILWISAQMNFPRLFRFLRWCHFTR